MEGHATRRPTPITDAVWRFHKAVTKDQRMHHHLQVMQHLADQKRERKRRAVKSSHRSYDQRLRAKGSTKWQRACYTPRLLAPEAKNPKKLSPVTTPSVQRPSKLSFTPTSHYSYGVWRYTVFITLILCAFYGRETHGSPLYGSFINNVWT